MAVTQGIKLDDETRQRLKALGAVRNRTPHFLMRTAIQDYLEREEKYEREKREDQERWDEYVLTGKAIDHETVTEWLNDLANGKVRPCPT